MQSTLKDVAKLAGVNFTLVSKYLNHAPGARMSAETRKKIDAAIRTLDYRPSAAGRALRSGRSHIVGLICGNLTNSYFAHAADCALKECLAHGYQLLIAFSDPEDPAAALHTLTGRGVDGIYGLSLSELPEEAASLPCPLVVNNLETERHTCVVIDSAVALDQALSRIPEAEITGVFTPPSSWEEMFCASMERIRKKSVLQELSFRREERRKQLRELCKSRPRALFSNGWETICALLEIRNEEFPDYHPQLLLHANCSGPFLGDPHICGVVESSSAQLIRESCRILLAQIESPDAPALRKTIPARFLSPGTPDFAKLVSRHFQLT